MSRVIDGGNVATSYTVFAAAFGDFFDSLLKGEHHEIPPGYVGRWKQALFDPAEDWLYFNSRSEERLRPVGREPLQRNFIGVCWIKGMKIKRPNFLQGGLADTAMELEISMTIKTKFPEKVRP